MSFFCSFLFFVLFFCWCVGKEYERCLVGRDADFDGVWIGMCWI